MPFLRLFLLGTVLALAALAFPHDAQAITWTAIVVDPSASPSIAWTSIALDGNGDLMITYDYGSTSDLTFAICDLSASAGGNCGQAADWDVAVVDSAGDVGKFSSLAINTAGDPMISYFDFFPNIDLRFAICDRSASANGTCDQTADWTTVTVDAPNAAGAGTSITSNSAGDPLISYGEQVNDDLKFAVCDISASVNGNCDQPGDWLNTVVDPAASTVLYSMDIAITSQGDPMISYYDAAAGDLRFATCDVSASVNLNCDQTGDWNTLVLDSAGTVGIPSAIAVTVGDDPLIAYRDSTNGSLKFAACDASASVNGNCDQAGDWSKATIGPASGVGSIAIDPNGDPVISYHDSGSLKFAICDVSASVGGDCTQAGDWYTETVDSVAYGYGSSIAVDPIGDIAISYIGPYPNGDIKFATSSDGDMFPFGTDNCPLVATPWIVPVGDTDCDAFTDTDEGSIGTDPADPCPDNGTDDAWPSDFDMNTVVNISDVFYVLPPYFGTAVPPTSARRDLVPDGVINISDVFRLLPPYFGWSCT